MRIILYVQSKSISFAIVGTGLSEAALPYNNIIKLDILLH